MDKPKWYEDLNDYAERISNMNEEELEKEGEMLARRITEINTIRMQSEINRLLQSPTPRQIDVINDYGENRPLKLREDNVHED